MYDTTNFLSALIPRNIKGGSADPDRKLVCFTKAMSWGEIK